MLQREADEVQSEVDAPSQVAQTDLIILTHDTREGTMNEALAQMQKLPSVLQPVVRIRKEELA
jgi:homoserine dehydrogenase